jgi:hypothetical protein
MVRCFVFVIDACFGCAKIRFFEKIWEVSIFFLIFAKQFFANHNKDYSVVKTFRAGIYPRPFF